MASSAIGCMCLQTRDPMHRARSQRLWRACSPGSTRSTIWMWSRTAACRHCSVGCTRPRRWASSCARSPIATSANSRRCRGRSSSSGPAGGLRRGSGTVTFVDVDSLLRRVYGKKKQGVGFGHAKVGGYQVLLRCYNPLVATISTPAAAPVIAATQRRAGNAGLARGAGSLVAEAIATKVSTPPDGAGRDRGAGRLGVLLPQSHRRLSPGRRAVLHHHPTTLREKQSITVARNAQPVHVLMYVLCAAAHNTYSAQFAVMCSYVDVRARRGDCQSRDCT